MKKVFKLERHRFDQTFTAREDSQNYQEDMVFGEEVVEAVYEMTWLLPGVTFNETYESNNGRYYVESMGDFNVDTTAIGDDSLSTGYDGSTQIPVSIDTKVSTKIDGLFTSKGLVGPGRRARLANQAGKALAQAWQNNIESVITASGTPFLYDVAVVATNPRTLLTGAKNQYKKANGGLNPTTCIISYDFEEALLNSSTSSTVTTPAANDQALVTGQIGVSYGMLLIPSDITEIFYMYNWEILHVPIAQDARDYTISDEAKVDEQSFGAVQVCEEVNAKAGSSTTYLHWNYGVEIVSPRQFLVATEIVTP